MTLERLFALGGCLACTPMASNPPMMVNATILEDISSRDETWKVARPPLEFSGGRASSCSSYSQLKSTGIVEDVSNQLVKSDYLICDVLERTAQSSNLKALPEGSYGRSLADRLDLRSFPSSLGPRVDEFHYTLSSLFDGQATIESAGVSVRTAELSFSLKVVLVGNVDHDGRPDWLVWLADEAIDGNYRGYQTLFVGAVPAAGLLRAHLL